MKKVSPLSIVAIVALLFSFSGSHAQRAVNKNVYCKFIQLPSHPLNTNKYNYIVYQNGEAPEAEVDVKQDYETVKKAYELEMKHYYVKMLELDQQLFEIGKSKELSFIKKQLKIASLNSQKPTKPKRTHLEHKDQMEFYVTEMELHGARISLLDKADLKMLVKAKLNALMDETAPVRPRLKKTSASGPYRLPDAIITEKMSIRGLERVYDDPKKTFFEISMSEFETKKEKKRSMGKDISILEYRRVVGYKVLDENNKIIAEGMIPKTDEWNDYDISTIKASEIKKKRKEFEKSSAENNLFYSKNFLAAKYGYPIENRGFELSYAKGKKFNYDNIKGAYETAVNIFKNDLIKENPDLSDLRKAIATWEEELKVADYSSKKARINTSVATGLYFNIIECSVWLNEFDKVEKLLHELSKLELKSKSKRKIDYYRDFVQDRKQRYEANSKMLVKN